jgi:hypothetical protein
MGDHGGPGDSGTANNQGQIDSEAAAVKKKPSANPITPGQITSAEQGKHALGMFPAVPFRSGVCNLSRTSAGWQLAQQGARNS